MAGLLHSLAVVDPQQSQKNIIKQLVVDRARASMSK